MVRFADDEAEPAPAPASEEKKKKKKKKGGGVRFFAEEPAEDSPGDAEPTALPGQTPGSPEAPRADTPDIKDMDANGGLGAVVGTPLPLLSREPPFVNVKNRTVYTLRVCLRAEGLMGRAPKKAGTYCHVRLETEDVSHRVRMPEKVTKTVVGSNPLWCDDQHAICFEVTDSDVSTVADGVVHIAVHAGEDPEPGKGGGGLFGCFKRSHTPFGTQRAMIRTQDVLMSGRKAIEQWIDLESGGRLHVAAELTGPEKGHLHFAMMPHERSVVVDHDDDEVFTVTSKKLRSGASDPGRLVVTVKDMRAQPVAVMEEIDDDTFELRDVGGETVGTLVVEGVADGVESTMNTPRTAFSGLRDAIRTSIDPSQRPIIRGNSIDSNARPGAERVSDNTPRATPRGSRGAGGKTPPRSMSRSSSAVSLPSMQPGPEEESAIALTVDLNLGGQTVFMRPMPIETLESVKHSSRPRCELGHRWDINPIPQNPKHSSRPRCE